MSEYIFVTNIFEYSNIRIYSSHSVSNQKIQLLCDPSSISGQISSTSKHGHWGRGHNHDFSISTGFDICKIEAVIRIGWLVAINLARFAGWGRWLQCNLMPSWDSGYIITFVLTGSTKLAQSFFHFLAKNEIQNILYSARDTRSNTCG